jgi:hypothetical protein
MRELLNSRFREIAEELHKLFQSTVKDGKVEIVSLVLKTFL